jgi:ribosome biogenesis GTPase A
MSIQWFPGHMTKARRELVEAMRKQDVVIEVLDARMPGASENPMIAEIRGAKPCIKVLSKSDLADPVATAAWIAHFQGRRDLGVVRAIALTTKNAAEARVRIPALCKELALHPKGPGKTPRVIVVGIPNVGKSTLINTLMERKVTKVGDKPAVTRAQQLVILKSGLALVDSPGVMWPKIEDPEGGLRLALGGAIPDTAIDHETIGLFAAKLMLARYPHLIAVRYKFKELPVVPEELVLAIGRARGALRAGGVVDVLKASSLLIADIRSGALGRVSLEVPRASALRAILAAAASPAPAMPVEVDTAVDSSMSAEADENLPDSAPEDG